MPRVSLDGHSVNMRTCFSFSLIVFLSSVDWSEEGCHDYFDDDWTSLIGTMVTLVEPKNLSDAAECTLLYLATNNTNASYILNDCFQEVTLQNITIKRKKCEAQRTYDVHISHLRCLLAKATGKGRTEGCEHESVCHLFLKAQPSTTQQPTAVTSQPTSPTVTSELSSTEIVKPSIVTTTIAVTESPRQTTTLPPEGTKDVTHQGNANPSTGLSTFTQDQWNTLLSLLIVACCFTGLLPVAVYVYMQRQISRYKKLLGVHAGTSFASLPMEEMQLPYRRCSTSPRTDSQDDIRQPDVHMQ